MTQIKRIGKAGGGRAWSTALPPNSKARLSTFVPISTNLILSCKAEHMLGLPRSR